MGTTRTSDGWGGRRSGAGRPKQRIVLDLETANLLRDITRRWSDEYPEADITPVYVLARLIRDEAQKGTTHAPSGEGGER